MCNKTTSHYVVCAHRREQQVPCNNYLSKPQVACQLFVRSQHINDECPQCSAAGKMKKSEPLTTGGERSPLFDGSTGKMNNSVRGAKSKLIDGMVARFEGRAPIQDAKDTGSRTTRTESAVKDDHLKAKPNPRYSDDTHSETSGTDALDVESHTGPWSRLSTNGQSQKYKILIGDHPFASIADEELHGQYPQVNDAEPLPTRDLSAPYRSPPPPPPQPEHLVFHSDASRDLKEPERPAPSSRDRYRRGPRKIQVQDPRKNQPENPYGRDVAAQQFSHESHQQPTQASAPFQSLHGASGQSRAGLAYQSPHDDHIPPIQEPSSRPNRVHDPPTQEPYHNVLGAQTSSLHADEPTLSRVQDESSDPFTEDATSRRRRNRGTTIFAQQILSSQSRKEFPDVSVQEPHTRDLQDNRSNLFHHEPTLRVLVGESPSPSTQDNEALIFKIFDSTKDDRSQHMQTQQDPEQDSSADFEEAALNTDSQIPEVSTSAPQENLQYYHHIQSTNPPPGVDALPPAPWSKEPLSSSIPSGQQHSLTGSAQHDQHMGLGERYRPTGYRRANNVPTEPERFNQPVNNMRMGPNREDNWPMESPRPEQDYWPLRNHDGRPPVPSKQTSSDPLDQRAGHTFGKQTISDPMTASYPSRHGAASGKNYRQVPPNARNHPEQPMPEGKWIAGSGPAGSGGSRPMQQGPYNRAQAPTRPIHNQRADTVPIPPKQRLQIDSLYAPDPRDRPRSKDSEMTTWDMVVDIGKGISSGKQRNKAKPAISDEHEPLVTAPAARRSNGPVEFVSPSTLVPLAPFATSPMLIPSPSGETIDLAALSLATRSSSLALQYPSFELLMQTASQPTSYESDSQASRPNHAVIVERIRGSMKHEADKAAREKLMAEKAEQAEREGRVASHSTANSSDKKTKGIKNIFKFGKSK